MLDILLTTQAQLVMMLAALAILVVIGYFVVRSFRDNADKNQFTPSDLITNFREMHHQGDISESEYRTIKTMLADKLQEKLKDKGDEG